MRLKIPFNPLKGDEEYSSKDPEDMTLDELEILLHSQRLAIKLEMERLEKKINYSKIIYDLAREFKISEKLEAWINKTLS